MTASRVLLAILSFAIANAAIAQTYPSKPIRLIVPSAAGGTPDIQARIVAVELGKLMGQQVVVDNRPGASGIIGFEMTAKAPPDGHTFGYASFAFITNPSMFAKLPYDTTRDFQPLVLQTYGGNFLTATPGINVKTVRELVEATRAQPGKLSYGSAGAGSSQHLALELLKMMTGVQIMQVSYKGIQQAISEMIAGQIHIVCDNATSILPYIRSGRVRALGFTMLKRSTVAPEIPTIDESGVPGFEMSPSAGYVLPARTPRTMVLRLNSEMNKVLSNPAIAEKFLANGSYMGNGSPEQFTEHLRRESTKWAGVIKAAGIKPQ